MFNRTIGEIEELTMQQYLLGAIIGLTFMSISLLNILFLICFYNLRHQAFVKNSIGIVSLVATDLINAIILTPTLFLCFFLPPPNDFSTCLVKSLPFMVSSYTSLLNMTSFCVHRFVIIRRLVEGRFKVHCTKYGFVTIVIWLSAILLVSLPYMFWPNSNIIILDCRRALFSEVEAALTMFAWQFDIPLIAMNVTLLTLVFMLKKYQRAKIASSCDNYDDVEAETNTANNIANVDGQIREPPISIPLYTKRAKVRTGNAASDLKLFDDESTSDLNSEAFKILVLPHGVETTNKSNGISSRNEYKCAYVSTTSIATNLQHSKQIGGISITDIETFRPDDNAAAHHSLPNLQRSSKAEFCNQPKRNDGKGYIFHELKQFLATMGILVKTNSWERDTYSWERDN